MARGRPQLPIGTYGDISCVPIAPTAKGKPRYKARARFRDSTGEVRPIARVGQTKDAAKRALRAALAAEQERVRATEVDRATTVAELADRWMAEGGNGTWSTKTAETYRFAVANIKDHLSGVRIGELRPPVVNSALERIIAEAGPSAAKTAKTALSGMVKLAVRYGAMETNPVALSVSVSRGARDAVRALTPAEVETLTDLLRSDERAVRWDLPDLVDWMLGTGARIGESCAARPAALTLGDSEGTWEINATLIRVTGEGLRIQPRPKTEAGWRVLALPPYLLDMLHRRAGELRLQAPEPVVFPSPGARALRDPSNTAGDLREVLDRIGCAACGGRGWHAHLKTDRQRAKPPQPRAGCDEPCTAEPPFAWVHSHVFRKTVATRLDEAGFSARQIADQLGHAKPSMTQDVYMGRRVVSAEAARVLNR